ncbi:hypothetical protein [Radiobacillus sp. PE A8.2]|uniref:hypothetical protein n=1 Tax=Radiobacillus sp. PE A8.2 TaxID=3380349 RepID=UPI00388F1C0F
MFLTEANLNEVVKQQYQFKLKAYVGVFSSLLVAQIIAILFSFAGMGNYSTSSMSYSIDMRYFSGDLIIGFTMIWAFVNAIIITTKGNKYVDFVFVTNRISSNISNIAFLLTASLIGAVTSILASFLVKVGVLYLFDFQFIAGELHTVSELLVGIVSTTLYIFLVASFGYFFGVLGQLSKLLIVFIPALFTGFLFLEARAFGQSTYVAKFFNFYVGESSMLLFLGKVLLTVITLYSGAVLISNRMEVRG